MKVTIFYDFFVIISYMLSRGDNTYPIFDQTLDFKTIVRISYSVKQILDQRN